MPDAQNPFQPRVKTTRVVPIKDSEHFAEEFGGDAEGGIIRPGAIERPQFDPEARFTARRGPRFELVREEIEILRTLSEAVEKRAQPDASEDERRAIGEQLLHEDAELARLWERLQELVRANDESIALALRSLEREEEEEEEEEEERDDAGCS
jgi:hypothetical protein